jgi:K+-sensing histidine kinase KdpD
MFIVSPRRAGVPLRLPSAELVTRLRGFDQRLHEPPWLYPAAVAVLCCLVWLLATEVVRIIGFGGFYGVPFALGAVVVAAWLAGLGAGLITASISVAMLHVLLPSMRMMDVQEESVWHLTVFSLVALIMSGFEAAVREQRQQHAREKEMRDEFLAIVSHELRTPATVISGSANLLSRLADSLTPEDREALLVGLQDESLRLNRMIDDLLLLARMESEADPVDEPVLLQPAVARSIQAFRRLNADRAVTLQAAEVRFVVQGRDVYIDAVLRNVLSNAHRFSPADLPIEIAVGREQDRAFVIVRDHGPGVSEELLKEIYRPYFRSQPLSDGTRGIGLGLALCKRAMESMGGRISARTCDQGGLEVELTFRLEETGMQG